MMKMIARIRQRQRAEPPAPEGHAGVVSPEGPQPSQAAVEQESTHTAGEQLPSEEAVAGVRTGNAAVSTERESVGPATLPAVRDAVEGPTVALQSEAVAASAPAGQQRRQQTPAVRRPREASIPGMAAEEREHRAAVSQESAVQPTQKDPTNGSQTRVSEQSDTAVVQEITNTVARKPAAQGKSGQGGKSSGKGRKRTSVARADDPDDDPEMAARKRLPGHPLGATEKLSVSVPLRICLYDGSSTIFLSPQVYVCVAEPYYGPTEQHPHLVLWEDRLRAQERLLGVEQVVLKDRSRLQVVEPPAEEGESIHVESNSHG